MGNRVRIVIVGGVAAGMSAASRARRHNPDAEIVVLERGEWISYAACGLPYALGGDVPKLEQEGWNALVARTPAQMRARGLSIRLNHEVTGVDAAARTVTVHDRVAGRTVTEPYDRLLLATGVSPVRPDWARTDLKGVHVLKDIPDAQAITESLDGARRVCIVGGGYIGLELAEAMRSRGLSVVLLEKGNDVAGRVLDDPYRVPLRAELERNGVEVRRCQSVEGLTGRAGRVSGVQTDAGRVQADAVLVAVGVQPNVELARAAGVRLGKSGAVAVNARQETNVPGIYAAGDCAESLHRVTRRRVHIPLALTANRMGRVAGVNMAGGDARFPGIVGTGIFKVFGLGAARTGITQSEAEAGGLDAVSVDIQSSDHAGYYRDARPLQVRLTAERGSGRLLGAQLVGAPHAVKRVDVVAALLHRHARVSDLAEADLAYAPPFGTTWDALLVAADRLDRALR